MSDLSLIEVVTSAAVEQYRGVQTATNTVSHGADDEDILFGITQHSAGSGEKVTVKTSGVSLCRVNGNSANISRGTKLEFAANGILVPHTADAAHYAVATALEPATADGVVIRVRIHDNQVAG